jgi:hypothetical protein
MLQQSVGLPNGVQACSLLAIVELTIGKVMHRRRNAFRMLLREPILSSRDEGAQHRSMEAFSHKIGIERRAKLRYPVELRVRYHILTKRHPVDGIGWTLDMSSTGLFISSQNEINTGERIEVSIQWPSELDDGVRLQLVAVGKVVRCDGLTFAVALGKHEFRTMKRATGVQGRLSSIRAVAFDKLATTASLQLRR